MIRTLIDRARQNYRRYDIRVEIVPDDHAKGITMTKDGYIVYDEAGKLLRRVYAGRPPLSLATALLLRYRHTCVLDGWDNRDGVTVRVWVNGKCRIEAPAGGLFRTYGSSGVGWALITNCTVVGAHAPSIDWTTREWRDGIEELDLPPVRLSDIPPLDSDNGA